MEKSHVSGQSLIELLIAIGLSMLLLPALITGLVAARNGRPQQDQRLQAVFLLKQEEEAIRSIREGSWANLTDGTFSPVIANGVWSLRSGSASVGGLIEQLVISDVYRNTNGSIVSTGGTIDLSTKKILMSVSWSTPLAAEVSSTIFLTRYGNTAYTENTYNQFNAGTKTNVAVLTTSGGEITLGAGGGGSDWCIPGNSVVAQADLPGQGVTENISATASSTLDYVYTTTGGNASGDSVDASTVDHSSPPNVVSNPPLASNNEGKAYGIFVDKVGGYVYFNENNPPNHTVRIANYTTLANVGYFDASSKGTGQSIFVLGTIGFTVVGSKLYTFDLSSINGSSSQTQLGEISLSASGNKVVVVKDTASGNLYAYIAESSSTKQLEIVQVSSDGKTLSIVANAQIANAQQGRDVFVNSSGSRAYLVTSQYASGQKQFFIINTQTKSGTLPVPIGSFSTYSATLSAGMNPNGVTVVSGNRAIVVGSGGQQYQVFNIANESSVSYCGGLTIAGGININAISSIYRPDQTAFSYILTNDSSHELQIIQGGNGFTISPSGTFESKTFTATTPAMFNSFSTVVNVPPQASLTFQIAIKNGNNNSCSGVSFSNADFVGPDGTTNTFFPSTGGILPENASGTGYVNPGQCLQYKAFLSTTDLTAAPIIYSVSFNYSP